MTPDLIAPAEARHVLGISAPSSFWEVIRKHLGDAGMVRYSPRLVRFERAKIEALRDRFKVKTAQDLKRLSDGRMK